MSAFLIEPCVSIPGSSEAETRFRQIFHQHWQRMREQLQTTARSIENWRDTTIEQIKKYADDQMRILGEDYDRQRLVLDSKCEESLNLMRSCYTAENIDLLNDMQNTWVALQCQVAQLEYVHFTINTPKVITVSEQMERAERQNASAVTEENLKLSQSHIDHSQNNPSDIKTESDKSTLAIPNEAQLHPSTTDSSNNKKYSTENCNDSRTNFVDNRKTMNKCPICFMIFPSSMTPDKCTEHVNEHYFDD